MMLSAFESKKNDDLLTTVKNKFVELSEYFAATQPDKLSYDTQNGVMNIQASLDDMTTLIGLLDSNQCQELYQESYTHDSGVISMPLESFIAFVDQVVKAAKPIIDEQEFLCPITLEFMTDPVMAPEGQNFDKKAINDWLANPNRQTNPVSKNPLQGAQLIANPTLQAQIQAYKATKADINLADCFCPLTKEIMKDPVLAADGKNYERQAYLNQHKDATVYPNITLRAQIDRLLQRLIIDFMHELEIEYPRPPTKGNYHVVPASRLNTRDPFYFGVNRTEGLLTIASKTLHGILKHEKGNNGTLVIYRKKNAREVDYNTTMTIQEATTECDLVSNIVKHQLAKRAQDAEANAKPACKP